MTIHVGLERGGGSINDDVFVIAGSLGSTNGKAITDVGILRVGDGTGGEEGLRSLGVG